MRIPVRIGADVAELLDRLGLAIGASQVEIVDFKQAESCYIHHTQVPVALTGYALVSPAFARGRFPRLSLELRQRTIVGGGRNLPVEVACPEECHRKAQATDLRAEGAREPRLSDTGRAENDQVEPLPNPLATREGSNQGLVDSPRRAVVRIFERCRFGEASATYEPFQLLRFSLRRLVFHEKAKAVIEGQLVEFRLLKL